MGLIVKAIVRAIAIYQAISRRLPPHCRFYPTCSAYARAALEHHGLARGLWLAARRILHCHPWHPGGVDEVPATASGAR